ncbi:hypothetical protein CLU81_0558 [Flavobacterium sp. 9]|uniref:hypothetical protein n=1 Tax=Flavobacterium sp. 9 TaxID=2035198 RepID=UPI000C185AD9|nr:hypothetical protein [Flavobacterium sp. 9]PIF30152.1 hypothetical protein CLU81_0558 [Flavobacterium sp. 9]
MKNPFIFIAVLLFYGCTNNKFSGTVYDYDTEKPIKNVFININGNRTQTDSSGYFCMEVKSDTTYVITLKKKAYATKNIYRTSDSLGKFSKRSLRYNRIYLFTEESDFGKK